MSTEQVDSQATVGAEKQIRKKEQNQAKAIKIALSCKYRHEIAREIEEELATGTATNMTVRDRTHISMERLRNSWFDFCFEKLIETILILNNLANLKDNVCRPRCTAMTTSGNEHMLIVSSIIPAIAQPYAFSFAIIQQ